MGKESLALCSTLRMESRVECKSENTKKRRDNINIPFIVFKIPKDHLNIV